MCGNTWFNGSLESFPLVFGGLYVFPQVFFIFFWGNSWFLGFVFSRFAKGHSTLGWILDFFWGVFCLILSGGNTISHISRDGPKILCAQENGFHDTLGFSYFSFAVFWPRFFYCRRVSFLGAFRVTSCSFQLNIGRWR